MKKFLFYVFSFLLVCNLLSAATVISGDISIDTNLIASNNPHQIRGNIRVLNGATLSLQPGVTVFFEPNSSLTVEGQISAMGSSDFPIVFTSFEGQNYYTRIILSNAEGSTFYHCSLGRSDDSTALLRIENSGTINILNCTLGSSITGNGIYINNSTVNINYTSLGNIAQKGVHINGSGSIVSIYDLNVSDCQTGIYVTQGHYPSLSWDNISIQHSSSYPIYAGLPHYTNLSGLSVAWAGIEMLAMWETNLYSSYTLPYQDLPYYLLGNLNLNNGAVLTLEPGVGFRFPEHGKLLLSGGSSLIADGSSLLPITFYPGGSYHWKGISLDTNCSATLDYCQFSGSGYPEYGYPEPSISANSFASLNISNTAIPGGTSYGLYISGYNNGILELNNVEITDCPWTGLYILDSTISLTYSNLSITDCGRPIAIPANLLNFLNQQPDLTDNTDNRIFLHSSGYIYRDTTVRDWGYPYVCEAIDINAHYINLTIDAGCVFQFGYALGFYINGTITAVGSSSEPIVFSKLPESSQNWRGFYLNSGTTYAHFNHCIVQHCSSSNQYGHIHDAFTLYRADTVLIENTQIIDAWCRGVYLESNDSDNDDLVINNLSIDGCGMDAVYQNASGYNLSINGLSVNNCNAFPVSVSANWAHQISNFNLSNNAHNVIRFVNGGYLASQTLANHGYPYQISGGQLYVNYTNVTFLPGTVFYFERYRSLEVSGTLSAAGTAEQPIVFDRPPAQTYFWDRIYLSNNSNASFSYCNFNNCGERNQYGYDNAFIDNAGATSLRLQNCEINNVDAQAISCHDMGSGDSVTINSVQITDCRTDGFWCNDSDAVLNINGLSVSGCLRNPISILPSLVGCLQNISLTDNTNNNIRLFSHNGISGNVHFANLGYIYRCEEGIIGNSGSSISFAPGCILWIADNRALTFAGAVGAIGTDELPIIFTRYPGSTNYWQGIVTYNSSWDADFVHCNVLYAGAQETYGGRRAFTNYGASNLNIANCTIQYSYGDGLVSLETQSTDVLSISNLDISDVAGTGLVCDTGYYLFSVDGLSITNCGTYPIYSGVELLEFFSDVVISNPGTPFIGLGNLYQYRNATWPDFGLPYRTNGTIMVNDGAVLNISAGTEIVFGNYVQYSSYPRIMVYGAINTLGTIDNPVVFRGLSSSNPSTWMGLRIVNPDAVCNLNYTEILNAGLDEGDTPSEDFCAVYFHNGTVNLSGCRIAISNHNLLKTDGNVSCSISGCKLDSGNNGIIHNSGTLNLANCTIMANSGVGLYHLGGSLNFASSSEQWNKLYGNTWNLRNNTQNTISAPYIYWGSVDQETIDISIFDNEEGTGKINFEPWFDQNCQNLYYHTLSAPQNLVITWVSDSLLRLSWSAAYLATSYKVLVSDSPNATNWSILQQNITDTTLDISPAPETTRRFYKVLAVQ